MVTTYYGIFPDSHTIEKHTLEEVNSVAEIEYILRCTKSNEWANPPTFTIINPKGTRREFRIGDFEVIDIEEESPGSNGGSKKILIKDLKTGDKFTYQSMKPGIKFFMDELIPFLKKLDEVGSWKMYQKLIELDEAYKTIEQLKAKIKTLEA